MSLKANLAIAEDNQQLKDAVAGELGEWPACSACWYDPTDEIYSDKSRELSCRSHKEPSKLFLCHMNHPKKPLIFLRCTSRILKYTILQALLQLQLERWLAQNQLRSCQHPLSKHMSKVTSLKSNWCLVYLLLLK